MIVREDVGADIYNDDRRFADEPEHLVLTEDCGIESYQRSTKSRLFIEAAGLIRSNDRFSLIS